MRRLVCCLALVLALPVQADSYTWGDSKINYEEDKTPWAEVEAKLPPAPKAEALLPFAVDTASSSRFFIDNASISVGEDSVVRYTVFIRSQAGAETVNHEGMRCTTGERKIYAFGRPDGTWSRNRYARWERFPKNLQSSYHRELYYSYFCAGGEDVPTLARIRQWFAIGGYNNAR